LVTLSAFQAVPLPGDYNHNGVVDAADFAVWRNTLGQSGTGLDADGNGNGTIESGDYNVWRAHFGKTGGRGAGARTAAPEPAAWVLVTIGIVTIGRRRRRAES